MSNMTAEDYIDAVRLLPCCVCGRTPVQAHHILGGSSVERLGARGSKKRSDWLSMPLCMTHHNFGADALHSGVLSWEQRYGTQVDFVTATGNKLGVDPWAEAAAEALQLRIGRQYRRPDKIMPRSGR